MKSILFLMLMLMITMPAMAVPAQSTTSSNVQASQAWIRVLPGTLPAGGYVTLTNSGDQDRIVIGASSTAYGMVMMHQSMLASGSSRMRMVKQLRIPAHGNVQLAPGGYHLMLMHAKQPVHPGNHVPITFHFADGNVLVVKFLARPANASGFAD